MSCNTPRFRPLPLNIILDGRTLGPVNQTLIQQLWTHTAQLINDTKEAEDELQTRIDEVELTEGADGDSIQVFLSSNNGVFFRNNITPSNKIITAHLYLNGVEVVNNPQLLYKWTTGGDVLYVDIGGNVVGTVYTQGLYAADGTADNGLNLSSIILDPSDVTDNGSLNIQCQISNF